MAKLKNRIKKLEIQYKQEEIISIHLTPIGYEGPTPEKLKRCPYHQKQIEENRDRAVQVWLNRCPNCEIGCCKELPPPEIPDI